MPVVVFYLSKKCGSLSIGVVVNALHVEFSSSFSDEEFFLTYTLFFQVLMCLTGRLSLTWPISLTIKEKGRDVGKFKPGVFRYNVDLMP